MDIIESKYLRVGNLLNGRLGAEVISAVFNNGVVYIVNNPTPFIAGICLKPIPITHELLLDNGFEFHKGEDGTMDYFVFGDFKLYWNDLYKFYCYHTETHSFDIYCVHDLQNGYEDITKKLLPFKV